MCRVVHVFIRRGKAGNAKPDNAKLSLEFSKTDSLFIVIFLMKENAMK